MTTKMIGDQFISSFVRILVTVIIVHQKDCVSGSTEANSTNVTKIMDSVTGTDISLINSTISSLDTLNVNLSSNAIVTTQAVLPNDSSDMLSTSTESLLNASTDQPTNDTQRLEKAENINGSTETNSPLLVSTLSVLKTAVDSTTSPFNDETGKEQLETTEENPPTSSSAYDELSTNVNSNTTDNFSSTSNVSSALESSTVAFSKTVKNVSQTIINSTFSSDENDNMTNVPLLFTENATVSENFTFLPSNVNVSINISSTESIDTEISNGNFSSIIDDNLSNSHDSVITEDNNVTSGWINSPAVFNEFTSSAATDFTDDNISYSVTETVFTGDDYFLSTVSAQPNAQFFLQLKGTAGNCTMSQEEFDKFEKDVRHQVLARAGVPDQNVFINMFNCSKNFLLNVSVSAEYANTLSQYFKKFDSVNNSKVQINDETYFMNVLGSIGSNAFKQPPEIVLSSRHTDIEFVIYVALGSACAFLLVLAVLLVMCKYCRTKPYKGFDVSDVSNLRLEDYTLTRIPRPKTVYNEYCKSTSNDLQRYCPLDEHSSQANGMVHPFDTSVVPLEDVPAKIDAESAQQGNASGPKGNPANHEYEEIDVNSVNSTENLHEQKEAPPTKPPWGVDNASFAT